MAQKIRVPIRGTQTSLRGGELEVVPVQPFKEGSYCLDLCGRIIVEHDHIAEVGRHLSQALNNHLVDETDCFPVFLGLWAVFLYFRVDVFRALGLEFFFSVCFGRFM